MYTTQGQDQPGSHGKINAGISIPPELWLSTFLYLDDKDLRAVTRTCSYFRLLAQPLLFRVFDVCPFFLAYNTDRIIYRPRQYLQTTLNRLDYYKSPRVAQAVTELWVSPYARNGFPARRLTDDLDPVLVISAVIDTLPAFPNLRSLTWHCIDIRPAWWTAIQRQSSLTRLWINSSTILPPSPTDDSFSTRPLKISRIDLDHYAWEGRTTGLVSEHEERLKGVDPVLLSLAFHAESIRSISVPRQDTALHLLSILGKVGSDTPYTLSSLTIPFSSTISEDFIPSLTAATSLKELHLLAPQEETISHLELKGQLPPTSLPLLEIYQGPYHLLPIFANVHHSAPRELRSVELWGLDEPVSMTVCDPYRLVAVLEEVLLCKETLSALESLSAIVTHVTMGLSAVLSRFPNLEAIFLESQDSLIVNRSPSPAPSAAELLPTSPIPMFYDLLQFHVFSPSLRRLSFITHFENTVPDLTAQCVDAAKFLEGLGQVNPSLETIDMRYGTYWTGVVDIRWSRRVFASSVTRGDSEPTLNVEAILNSTSPSLAPPLQRSSTEASVSSISDSSEAAVEKFFSLPSKRSSTITIHLHFGDMTLTEQRRAVLLPDVMLPAPPSEIGVPRLGWLAGGVNRIWYLAGKIGKMLGEGVGIARN